jgi:hypothetical protein
MTTPALDVSLSALSVDLGTTAAPKPASQRIPCVPLVPTRWAQELDAFLDGQEDEATQRLTVEAFLAVPIAADDLTALSGARGKYRVGDTRGFVLTHEQACLDYNCWMMRDPDGSARYVSESPVLKAAPIDLSPVTIS